MPLYPASSSVSGWNIKKKTVTENRNTNTTLTADSILQFSVTPGKTYLIRGRIFYDTPAAADFKWDLDFPGLFGILRMRRACIVPGATAYSNIAVNTGAVTVTMTSTTGTGGFIELDGFFIADPTTGGTFSFRWAQNSSNGSDTSVFEGSYLEYVEQPSSV